MPAPRGPRGETVTVVVWLENGAINAEVYAAKGGTNSRATHMTAHDRVRELTANTSSGIVGQITLKVK